MPDSLKFAVRQGSRSGDSHAARLVSEILSIDPGVKFFGMGGKSLRRGGKGGYPDGEGFRMGISEVISRIGDITGLTAGSAGSSRMKNPTRWSWSISPTSTSSS